MSSTRPVTIPQFYRLIPLNCLRLDRENNDGIILFETAFARIGESGRGAPLKTKERVATPAQLYRLNQFGYLQLVPNGEGQPVPFSKADAILAETAERGLWTPKSPRARAPA